MPQRKMKSNYMVKSKGTGKNSAAAAYADYVEDPQEQTRVESASKAIAIRHHEELSLISH